MELLQLQEELARLDSQRAAIVSKIDGLRLATQQQQGAYPPQPQLQRHVPQYPPPPAAAAAAAPYAQQQPPTDAGWGLFAGPPRGSAAAEPPAALAHPGLRYHNTFNPPPVGGFHVAGPQQQQQQPRQHQYQQYAQQQGLQPHHVLPQAHPSLPAAQVGLGGGAGVPTTASQVHATRFSAGAPVQQQQQQQLQLQPQLYSSATDQVEAYRSTSAVPPVGASPARIVSPPKVALPEPAAAMLYLGGKPLLDGHAASPERALALEHSPVRLPEGLVRDTACRFTKLPYVTSPLLEPGTDADALNASRGRLHAGGSEWVPVVIVLKYDTLCVRTEGAVRGSPPLYQVQTGLITEAVWSFQPEKTQRVLLYVPSRSEAVLFELEDDRGKLVSVMNSIVSHRQSGSIRNALPNEDVVALSRPPALPPAGSPPQAPLLLPSGPASATLPPPPAAPVSRHSSQPELSPTRPDKHQQQQQQQLLHNSSPSTGRQSPPPPSTLQSQPPSLPSSLRHDGPAAPLSGTSPFSNPSVPPLAPTVLPPLSSGPPRAASPQSSLGAAGLDQWPSSP